MLLLRLQICRMYARGSPEIRPRFGNAGRGTLRAQGMVIIDYGYVTWELRARMFRGMRRIGAFVRDSRAPFIAVIGSVGGGISGDEETQIPATRTHGRWLCNLI
jgi:hypothetical protein